MPDLRAVHAATGMAQRNTDNDQLVLCRLMLSSMGEGNTAASTPGLYLAVNTGVVAGAQVEAKSFVHTGSHMRNHHGFICRVGMRTISRTWGTVRMAATINTERTAP